tara:strand:- start:1295 stop:1729 length:435 start_codon:yes stop_codon:yes gene_type:complete
MLKNLSVTNMLYGIGAAIVILGALFKIQHWNGGSLLLTIGMVTEAVVFTYSAFEKKKEEIDESRRTDPYDPKAIIEAQKEYVKQIKNAVKNVSLMNEVHENQLKLAKSSTGAYKTINTEANSLAQHTYFMSKTYYSILKAMKSK